MQNPTVHLFYRCGRSCMTATCRRYLQNGVIPPAGAVRIEEMINYFDYDYPKPTNEWTLYSKYRNLRLSLEQGPPPGAYWLAGKRNPNGKSSAIQYGFLSRCLRFYGRRPNKLATGTGVNELAGRPTPWTRQSRHCGICRKLQDWYCLPRAEVIK